MGLDGHGQLVGHLPDEVEGLVPAVVEQQHDDHLGQGEILLSGQGAQALDDPFGLVLHRYGHGHPGRAGQGLAEMLHRDVEGGRLGRVGTGGEGHRAQDPGRRHIAESPRAGTRGGT